MEEPAKIIKLDETVINRIAAGEVIQRPANALKEMIENSLDAKSTNIQVTVKHGGLKLLQIQDNGTGIRKADFEIVCERFTTSKLREFEDLNSIGTYGFRGEALASISHVAHLTITSKTADEKCAYTASYEDGAMKGAVKPTAGNQGTQITVEDLFYNMNVRRKALRSPAEEYQKISDVVGKYAIHNANVGFGLKKHGENNDIRTPPNSTQIDNIRTIFGNLIARELIEFAVDNDALKFNARGYMTNVNYSTKKFTFLLFINHRLVDCQSLRKCVDQVYATYLPKNTHPFVYLSVELDPRNVDVNVHPTKHEVHFFNEDQIVEALTTAVETKLLGSNNSRVFYMQAKLPGVSTETKTIADKKLPVVRDKDLVRTDCAEQKLTKFFGAPSTSRSELSESKFDEDFAKTNREFLEKNERFEDLLANKTIIIEGDNDKDGNKNSFCSKLNSNLIARVETQLSSVLELRKNVEDDCHKSLRELFSQHVFVGSINTKQSLIQYSTKLFLCNTQKIMQELFYQFILYNFQNFGVIQLSDPLPVQKLAAMALNLPEVGWTPEDGDKTDLARKVAEILTEKGEMLNEYFGIDVDEYGSLKSLPILLENHLPEMTGLPLYVLRLATEVDWESEKKCFRSFAVETSSYYSETDAKNANWKWTTEHVLYPAVKDYFLPPKSFTENGAVLQIADLPNLYKVFERC